MKLLSVLSAIPLHFIEILEENNEMGIIQPATGIVA
jgi:hypothetical protein